MQVREMVGDSAKTAAGSAGEIQRLLNPVCGFKPNKVFLVVRAVTFVPGRITHTIQPQPQPQSGWNWIGALEVN